MMKTKKDTNNKFFLIGLATAITSISALEDFFLNLPEDPNAAFIILDSSPSHEESLVDNIRVSRVSMPIEMVKDGIKIIPKTVYLLPPNNNFIIESDRFYLEHQSKDIDFPIDNFFKTLAKTWKEKTIGALIGEEKDDGNEGLEKILEVGGISFKQTPKFDFQKNIPSKIANSKSVNLFFSVKELATRMIELTRFFDRFPSSQSKNKISFPPKKLKYIINLLAQNGEIDFSKYKTSTISRRINNRCGLTQSADIDEYIDLLKNSENEQKALSKDFLIGATQFFRDEAAWEFLEEEVLPKIITNLKENQPLRIWVSACSTGEEAYSIAILVDEILTKMNKSIPVKIFVTDIDTEALQVAAEGIYPHSIDEQISPERLNKYFKDLGNNYQVKHFLREMLIIAPHDLTKIAGFSKMNLVTCRNVLIYMQPQLQHQVLRLLHFALVKDGVLFLGNSENLGDFEEEFACLNSKWKIFEKLRETSMSLMPFTEQKTLSSFSSVSNRIKPRNNPMDYLVENAFNYVLGEKKVTCVLVNKNNQLLRVFYNNAKLLDFPIGETVFTLTEIVPRGLKFPLSTALHRAKQDKQEVVYTGIKLKSDGEEKNINLKVGFNSTYNALSDYLIVVLEVQSSVPISSSIAHFEFNEEAAQHITELEEELQQTRENLQVTIEELESTNEEQQATNEELLATNEELQSTNEQLQSVNEELYGVNSQYQEKIQELTQLNNDMNNLLRSTNLGVVFLDTNLHIRKFTPPAKSLINVKSSDIGRPLGDLTHNFSCCDNDCLNLVGLLKGVLDSREEIEKEIVVYPTHETLLMRVNLYIREDGINDGIVLTFINIDKQKKTNEKLNRINERLKRLYENTNVGLCLFDENLNYLEINPALADINGFSVEEHIGKNIRTIIPDLADHLIDVCHQVLENKEVVENIEVSGVTAKEPNKIRHWIASYHPVSISENRTGVGGVVFEITPRVEAEQALIMSKRKLTDALSLIKLGSWEKEVNVNKSFNLFDENVSFSDELFDILGFDINSVKPTFSDFVSNYCTEDKITLKKAIEQLFYDATPYNLDLEYCHPDGKQRYFNIIGKPITNEKGKVFKVYGTVMDITERKEIENTLTNQKLALEEAIAVAQAADSANEAKSEFLANMSHEIRTPMNIVLGMTQLLQRTELNEHQGKLADKIMDNGQVLLQLIEDILDISKLEVQKLDLHYHQFNLQAFLHSKLQSWQNDFAEKNLTLNLDIESDVPSFVIGDDLRVQQVLSNLVSNAIKFTHAGQVSVRVFVEKKVYKYESHQIQIRFEVEDTGIGIDSQKQAVIFEPFTQGDNSTTRKYGGTGLGLSICRRLVELMRGKIGVRSEPDVGSTFWFTIPFILPKQDLESSLSEESLEKQNQQLLDTIKGRILLVEDYQPSQDLMEMMLSSMGYKPDKATNGKEAVDLASNIKYDLIFMDCQMPVMDGYEATQAIRKSEENSSGRTTIIGLTADAVKGEKEKCLSFGMDDYLRKPLSFEDLDRIFDEYMSV